MKKLLFFISIVLLMSSCMTKAKIARNCDKFLEVCGTPEKETVYKDTTIYIKDTVEVFLPSDTVKIEGDVYVDQNGLPQMEEHEVESDLITAKVGVKDGKFEMISYINKTSIPLVMNYEVTLERAIRETSEVQVVKVKYIPKFYKFTHSFFIVVCFVVIGFFLIKYRNPVFGFLGKLIKLIFK